jgi:Ca2+-binding EF-hand superfamily protein
MKMQLAVALGLVMGSTSAFAQKDFSNWDNDNNGAVSQQEFAQGIKKQGFFDRWDDDGNGQLNRDEFQEVGANTDFETFDANNDDYLTEDEFSTGFYDTWDADNDTMLSENEWDDASDEGWFDV